MSPSETRLELLFKLLFVFLELFFQMPWYYHAQVNKKRFRQQTS